MTTLICISVAEDFFRGSVIQMGLFSCKSSAEANILKIPTTMKLLVWIPPMTPHRNRFLK